MYVSMGHVMWNWPLPDFLAESLSEAGVTWEDVDVVVPHQASKALDMIMARLNVAPEKYINRVGEYGNMISASIPYTLCEIIHEGKVKTGDLVMLMGTAAGLTSNVLLLKY